MPLNRRTNTTAFVDRYLVSVILLYLLVKNQSTFFVLHTYIDMIVKNGHRFPSEMLYLQNVRDKKKLILDAKKYRNLHDREALEFDTKLPDTYLIYVLMRKQFKSIYIIQTTFIIDRFIFVISNTLFVLNFNIIYHKHNSCILLNHYLP